MQSTFVLIDKSRRNCNFALGDIEVFRIFWIFRFNRLTFERRQLNLTFSLLHLRRFNASEKYQFYIFLFFSVFIALHDCMLVRIGLVHYHLDTQNHSRCVVCYAWKDKLKSNTKNVALNHFCINFHQIFCCIQKTFFYQTRQLLQHPAETIKLITCDYGFSAEISKKTQH